MNIYYIHILYTIVGVFISIWSVNHESFPKAGSWQTRKGNTGKRKGACDTAGVCLHVCIKSI